MNNFIKSKNKQRENKMSLKATSSKSNFDNIRNIVEENKIRRVVENNRENNTENSKENNSSEKKCKIEIIRAGESKNGRIYTEESIAKIPNLIEGKKKMFIDHTDDLENRSLKDWAATIINVWYDEKEKTVFAEIRVHSDWLWERIIDSPQEIGVSIDAVGVLSEQGGFIYVKDIIELNSVDFVTSAAAGGGIYNSLIKESIRQSVIRENIKESERESVTKIVESIALKLERNMEKNIRESIKENIREEFRKEIESLKEKNKSLAREGIIEKYISMLNIDKDNKAFFKKFMDYVFEKECENIESGIENSIEDGMEKKVYKDMPSDADNYTSDDMSNNIIDEDFDEDVYEEVARVAIKNLLNLFENVKKTLYEKNNAKNNLQNNSNESEDNLLTVFDLVKINSIGLDSKDKRVREKYLSLYLNNNI